MNSRTRDEVAFGSAVLLIGAGVLLFLLCLGFLAFNLS